jgi:hypothetical protein
MKRLRHWTKARCQQTLRLELERLETRQVLAGGCLEVTSGFTFSSEYFTNLVTAGYEYYLRRSPDDAGLNHWVRGLEQGLRDEEFEAGLLSSREYIGLQGDTDVNWIEGLYADVLRRTASRDEINFWLSRLDAGAQPFDVALAYSASTEHESLLVTDYYATYLGRSPSTPEVTNWGGLLQQGFEREDVIAGFLSSEEYFVNHGNENTSWLIGIYKELLLRTPADSEVNHWLEVLASGTADVALQLSFSREYFENLTTTYYETYLRRAPDDLGLNDWARQLEQGLTDEELEAALLSSAEYIDLQGGTDVDWIDGLYADVLGRSPGASEVDLWLGQLDAGIHPYDVALAFSFSSEHEGLVIADYYAAYLGRTAQAAEINLWVNALHQSLEREDVVAAFVGSFEFYQGVANNEDWIIQAHQVVLGRVPVEEEIAQWLPLVC